MGSSPQFAHLRAHAIELRRAGKSRREIRAILGIASNQTLGDALRGGPPPGWTRRPNAKDGVRANVIRLFLAFLSLADVAPQQLRCRVHIHETADIEAATRYWQIVTGASPDLFRQPNIKRHKPRTTRRNTGAGYHGCLQIWVPGSRDLYLKTEGWASAIMAAANAGRDKPRRPGPGADADHDEPGAAPLS